MSLRIPLLLSLLAAGCSAGPEIATAPPGASATPPRESSETPTASGEVVQNITTESFSDSDISDYCASRSDAVVRDSLVVSPLEFDLEVGDVLSPLAFTTTSARTGARVPVHYDARPASLVRFEDWGVRALAPGTAYLEVRPLCPASENAGDAPTSVVRLTISE